MGKATPPTTDKLIAYYRVSTAKQGQSGLGLEAQQASVQQYAAMRRLEIVNSYVEVETGTNKRRRPKLHAALDECKATGAVLIIAKLDRLTRNVHFLTGLLDSGVKFIAVDMPEADESWLQMATVWAQREAKLTSERTKVALQAAKARGTKLGNPQNLTPAARAKGPQSKRDEAREAYAKHLDYIRMMREQNMTLRAIAERLNKHHTTRGDSVNQPAKFTAATVQRILKRADSVK